MSETRFRLAVATVRDQFADMRTHASVQLISTLTQFSRVPCRGKRFAILIACVALIAGGAAGSDLAFKPAAEPGFFSFDTGALRGRVRLNGQSQGIVELVHSETGVRVAAGDGLPGVLSYYRVFSTDARYGHAARDWPTVNRLLPDGALEVVWASAEEHPLEMTAVYRWSRADTLDLETRVRPQRDLPRFEVFLSSYFTAGFQASVYVRPNRFASGQPALLPVEVNPMIEGTYLMFPRDREAVLRIFDRRWEFPPDPVQWSVTRWLAGPLAVRRDAASQVTALLMAPPEDCFAVATPYNKTPPDGVAGHYSLYLSLFGQDLAAGQTARARSRLVVGRGLSDAQAVERYQQYIAEASRAH
jgi:hypothetical protein